jgi:hypothetical protein
MKTSEIFKMAGKMLASEVQPNYNPHHKGEQFVCIALMRLANQKRVSFNDSVRCKQIIRDLLGDRESLESWLMYRGYLPEVFLDNRALCRKIMRTRKAWVKHLVNHYAAQGD